MSRERDPESEAAREVFDAIIEAKARGEVSQGAVSWAGTKAFEQFRKEAMAWAEEDYAREAAVTAAVKADKRRKRWSWLVKP